MKIRYLIFALCISLIPSLVISQDLGKSGSGKVGVTKEMLLHPPADSWPTHHGDYSGRRFSNLKLINDTNVHDMSLAWTAQVTGGIPAATGRGGGVRGAI